MEIRWGHEVEDRLRCTNRNGSIGPFESQDCLTGAREQAIPIDDDRDPVGPADAGRDRVGAPQHGVAPAAGRSVDRLVGGGIGELRVVSERDARPTSRRGREGGN